MGAPGLRNQEQGACRSGRQSVGRRSGKGLPNPVSRSEIGLLRRSQLPSRDNAGIASNPYVQTNAGAKKACLKRLYAVKVARNTLSGSRFDRLGQMATAVLVGEVVKSAW